MIESVGGMDDVTDLTEVLEDDSALEQFQLKLFETARFMRAAATIDAGPRDENDERDQVERAASVGAVQRSSSGGIGLGRSASVGGDVVSWLTAANCPDQTASIWSGDGNSSMLSAA